MNDQKFSELGQTDLFCLWADWLSGDTTDERAREIAVDIARPDSRIFAALEEFDEAIAPLYADSPFRKPLEYPRPRWWVAAFAMAASVLIALSAYLVWNQRGQKNVIVRKPAPDNPAPKPPERPGPRPEVKPEDSPSGLAPGRMITNVPPASKRPDKNVDGAPKDDLPRFSDALATLEKRVSAKNDPKELRKSYDQLLKDYPDHAAEIKSNPVLARALAPPVSPVESARDALLAKIALYAGKSLAVSDAKVRALREEVVRYRQEHPEPKVPEIEAFADASEPTPRNEVLYAETRAKELMDAPKDDAGVRELRGTVLTLRFRDDTRPLVLESKSLTAFMNAKQNNDPAAKAEERKTEVAALVDRLAPPNKRGPYLLCVLPPGIRGEAVALYKDIQTYARSPGLTLDASLLDYLARARRPIKQDTMGIIIPMYIYPDRNNPEPWDQVLALANQSVRIKVIINPNMDNVQEADPAYVAVIDLAHQRGIEVLGRVSCQGGRNGLTVAQSQVLKWHNFYPNKLDGLFFGDQDVDAGLVELYTALYRSARGLERHWQIVACPGSPCKEAFLTETGADILCPSSNTGGPYTMGWEAKYDPEHFAALINDVTDETLVPGFLMNAVEKHFGWVYVGSKDAFRVMPPYLGMELRWIQEMNQRILNGNEPAPTRRPNPAASKKRGTPKRP